MKKVTAIFLCFTISLSAVSIAQTSMPSFPEVVNVFFRAYSYEPKERNDQLVFAKKAKGWFVQVIDRLHNDSIITEQLFWDNGENKYLSLDSFEQGQDAEAAKKTSEMIRGDGGPVTYGYERCRYFGYSNWDVDMIMDFATNIPVNDTLLEGLARAYANYAERYIDYGLGGKPYDDDPLKARLGKFEPRSPERIRQFMLYINKAIDCYRILQERNPGYLTLIGTPQMKLMNEQFHEYQQLLTYGYTKEAQSVLATVQNSDIYRQIGHMYLDACPPNSILITYGDNDTYPLWYVQVKDGFRKDVTVLNNSLLGTTPYVNMIKTSKPATFSTTSGFLKRLKYEYFYFMEDSSQVADISIALPTFINELQKIKYPYVTNDTLGTYRVKTVLFDINLSRLKKICNQANLVPGMSFQLTDYILLSDFILLDILYTNLYTRPIYVTAQASIFPGEYLQHEGSVYRVLPLSEHPPEAKTRIEVAKIESYLLKNYKPVVMKYGSQLQQSDDALHGLQANLFADLINGYTVLKNTAKANEWAAKYISHPDLKKFPVSLGDYKIAEALLSTGYNDEAKVLVERIAGKLMESYKRFSALDYYYYSKEDAISWLEYLKSLLHSKNIDSRTIEELISKINNESDD